MNYIEESGYYFPLVLVFLLVPLITGIYVYRDARSREMNPVGWTIVAALIPCFVGLLIYFFARLGNSNLQCPQCGKRVSEPFISCPSCGCRLKDVCPQCGRSIDPAWVVCPNCSSELPAERVATPPIRVKDRGFWIRAAVFIIIGSLLFYFAYSWVMGPREVASSYTSEVLELSRLDGTVQEWARECDAMGKGYYVLQVDKEDQAVIRSVRAADGALDDSWKYDEIWKFKHNYAYFVYYSGGKAYFAESLTEATNDFFPENYVLMQYDRDEVGPTGNPVFLAFSSQKKVKVGKAIRINDTGKRVGYQYAELKGKKIIWK